jgi:DNA-binding response OmpR family regulator
VFEVFENWMFDHHVPLIVIASASSVLADSMASRLRREGNVVYIAHSAEGCLRVATSVHADVVLLDPMLAGLGRLEKLLKAHPFSAGAKVLHLSEALPRTGARVAPAPPATHAA